MDQVPKTAMMCFRGLEEEVRYKKLERLIKRSQKGQQSSLAGGNDVESSEVSLSISSIAPETNDSLETRQFLHCSKTGSYVLASSNDARRIHSPKEVGNGRHQALATSSVKDYWKCDKRTNNPRSGHDFSSPGHLKRYDQTRAISDTPSSNDKQAPINDGSCHKLSCFEKPLPDYSRRGVGARFARWTIMLNEQRKLILKGNLIGGSYCQSKPVLRKVSAKMVETVNKSLYNLEGNINDENHVLPTYVRGKFHDGFPDDWENVYQVWLEFIRQGSPLNFHWPTDIADSDDDLRSEMTDVTVGCHSSSLPRCEYELSHVDADCSDLSRQPLSPMELHSPTHKGGLVDHLTANQEGMERNDSDQQPEIDEATGSIPLSSPSHKVSSDFDARSESNRTLPFQEEVDALYKKFLSLFDRLRSAALSTTLAADVGEKGENATSSQQQCSSGGTVKTVPNQENCERAQAPSRLTIETSAIDSNDRESPERPPKMSIDSDESESEVYAGVRKIPAEIILSNWKHISDESKRMGRRKSRDLYVRARRRIRNVNSWQAYGAEKKERNRAELKGVLQQQYGEEEATGHPKLSLRMPLSHIDSRLNVQLNPNNHRFGVPPHPVEQCSMSSRLLGRDVATDVSGAGNEGIAANKKGDSTENSYSKCKVKCQTSFTRRADNRVDGIGQPAIPASPVDCSTSLTLGTAVKSCGVMVEESPSKKNQPVHRVSSSKRNDFNANAERNSVIQSEENDKEGVNGRRMGSRTAETEHRQRLSEEKPGVMGPGTPQLLRSWVPRVVRKSISDVNGNLVFHGQLINGAGHLVRRNVTTGWVRRRLSRSRIETIDSEVYELVGDMVDPRNTVPKRLLTQSRYGCPAKIEDFCKAWIASLLPETKDEKKWPSPKRTHDASVETLNVTVSSKGRRILPPLSYWTGERVVLKDNNPVYSPGIALDIKEGALNNQSIMHTSRNYAEKSGKRGLSPSAGSNDEKSPPPPTKKRRKTSSLALVATQAFSTDVSSARRSQRIHHSRVANQAHTPGTGTVKSVASLPGQEELDASPSKTARVQKLRKASLRLTSDFRHEKFNVLVNEHGKASSVDLSGAKSPNLKSSIVRRREEKVSYNFYRNCPSQEDALSDDQLSHV